MQEEDEKQIHPITDNFKHSSLKLSVGSLEKKEPDSSSSSASVSGFRGLAGLRVGSLMRTWAEVSRINFISALDLNNKQSISLKRKSIASISKENSIYTLLSNIFKVKNIEKIFPEEFPVNVTSLMNEDQNWGCFYIFPELYSDLYAPVIQVKQPEDVPEIVDGVLTEELIAAHLSYLKRSPILDNYVYIKLDLSAKHLVNVKILQNYKFLVWLDLSSNYLTELTVLTHLPYLQFLNVNFNRLSTVLEYDTPQWFLTEVHYKYNSVKKIRDLTPFWSIAVLDLSHNNIKIISGLENLKFLRHLDLSFNHIQRLENLNHLQLLWLDVSYNNISSFQHDLNAGLWTLMELEYLNLNENNLMSMKIFSGCIRLRELHARNNRLGNLLELAVYMRQMKWLVVLDLRANPICSTPSYKKVVLNTFPILLSLDAEELDAVEQRSAKMDMSPDIMTFATRRLLRLLYIEQLSRAQVSPFVPPADTTDIPLVVLVGYEAVGKGTLARRLAYECKDHIQQALLHTTSVLHNPEHYRHVSRTKFDDMLINGDFLTYSEMNGESYGLSREEAFVRDGKVKVACMDLLGALMLHLRGYRPYLILITCSDQIALAKRQEQRYVARNDEAERRLQHSPLEKSTLQVLLSGRIMMAGILNEILINLKEEDAKNEFQLESECSLLMDSEARVIHQSSDLAQHLLSVSSSSSDESFIITKNNLDSSMHSLYKESQHSQQGTTDYNSGGGGNDSYTKKSVRSADVKPSNLSRHRSVDFSKYTSSTWKGQYSTKSSKSVTFTSQESPETAEHPGSISCLPVEPPSPALMIHAREKEEAKMSSAFRSISERLKGRSHRKTPSGSGASLDDLWIAFLVETGILQASDVVYEMSESKLAQELPLFEDPRSIIRQLDYYHKSIADTQTSSIRDDYESIHRNKPGLFWDTVSTDNADEAFLKLKRIIKEIVNSQKTLKPMLDIDFVNLEHYPLVQDRLAKIREEIAPHRLFY